jgi:DNA-binding GntR family transcriptional regulator
MSADGPIERRPLHEELAERIRILVVEGRIPAGTRIDERGLCERFGVSRTPLREAIKVLAREGYVTLLPNRGAVAAELTRRDLEEAFPIMGALEALAGELAALHATDEQIATIRAVHDRMREHHAAGDRPAYFALNERIHLAIAEASGNATLERMQRSLDGRVRRGRYQANIRPERWDRAMAEHERIVEALEARDGPTLAAVLREHLAGKLAALRQSLPEE